MSRLAGVLAPTLFVALLLGVWEAACRLLHVPQYFLPPPSAIGRALVDNAPLLATSAARTLGTALAALLTASLIANSLALIASFSGLLESSFRPLVVAIQVTPIVALAPLFQVWAGVDHPDRAVIALATMAAFFSIYSGTSGGLKAADPDLVRLLDLYGASRWQKLVKLRLPSSIPYVLEGHKVAMGLALVGAVVGEFSAGAGGAQGLAWRILEASNRLEMDKSFAALATLALMAAGVHLVFLGVERRALAWWRGR